MEKAIRRWKKNARKASPAEKIKLLHDILEKDPPDRKIWEDNLRFCQDALFQELLTVAATEKIDDVGVFLEKVLQLDDGVNFCDSLPDHGRAIREKFLDELHQAASLQDFFTLEKGLKIWKELDFSEDPLIDSFQEQLNEEFNSRKNRRKIHDLTFEIIRKISGNCDYREIENYYNIILMSNLQINGKITDKITDYISAEKRKARRLKRRKRFIFGFSVLCFCILSTVFAQKWSDRNLSNSRSETLKELYKSKKFRKMTDLMALYRKDRPGLLKKEPLLTTMKLLEEEEKRVLSEDIRFEFLLRNAENFPEEKLLEELNSLLENRKNEHIVRYRKLCGNLEKEKIIQQENAGKEFQKLMEYCTAIIGSLKKGESFSTGKMKELLHRADAFPDNKELEKQLKIISELWKYNRKKEYYCTVLNEPPSASELFKIWEDAAFLFPDLAVKYKEIQPHLPLWQELFHAPALHREQLEDPAELFRIISDCKGIPRTPAEADLKRIANASAAELIGEMLELMASYFPEKGLYELIFCDMNGKKHPFYFTSFEVERTNFNGKIKTVLLYSPGKIHSFRKQGEFYFKTDLPSVPLKLETFIPRKGELPEAAHWKFYKYLRDELKSTAPHRLPETLRNSFYQVCQLHNVPLSWKKSTLDLLLRYRAELSPLIRKELLELEAPYDDSELIEKEKILKKELISNLCKRLYPAAFWNGERLIYFYPAKELLLIRYGEKENFTVTAPSPGDPPGAVYFSRDIL